MRNPPPEEEGSAEKMCDKLTSTPIPYPPVPLRQGKEVKKLRVKSNPVKREGWGQGGSAIWFYYPILI